LGYESGWSPRCLELKAEYGRVEETGITHLSLLHTQYFCSSPLFGELFIVGEIARLVHPVPPQGSQRVADQQESEAFLEEQHTKSAGKLSGVKPGPVPTARASPLETALGCSRSSRTSSPAKADVRGEWINDQECARNLTWRKLPSSFLHPFLPLSLFLRVCVCVCACVRVRV